MSLILNKLKNEAVIFCPLCNKEYQPTNMRVLEQAGDTLLAHSHCPNCKGAILSLLYKDLMGITLVGMVTDLDYEDALRVKNGSFVDNDDVLTIYKLVK
jgi:hypothetical protein